MLQEEQEREITDLRKDLEVAEKGELKFRTNYVLNFYV